MGLIMKFTAFSNAADVIDNLLRDAPNHPMAKHAQDVAMNTREAVKAHGKASGAAYRALTGIINHNNALKPEYKISESLIREVRAALDAMEAA